MSTSTTGVPFVHAAELLAAHLADHGLPEPASLAVTTRRGHSEVTAQLCSNTVPGVVADLLLWAESLTTVTVTAWRPPPGDRVHLSIASTLAGPASTVELDVFGGADYDPVLFADLEPGERRTVSLGDLLAWAGSASTTTGAAVLEVQRAER